MAIIPLAQMATGGEPVDTARGALGAVGTGAKGLGWLAKLADYPDVAAYLNSLAGPLAIGTGIASGDPYGIASGAGKLVGSAGTLAGIPGAGAVGGAVGTGLALAHGIQGGDPMEATTGTLNAAIPAGLSLALSGAPGIAGAGMGFMASIPLMMGTALAMEGPNQAKMQELAQGIERSTYAKQWPGLTGARKTGAGLLDLLPEIRDDNDPAGLKTALQLSTRGIRADNLASGYENLIGDQGGKPNDLSDWAAKAPGYEGQNWGSWLGLMDAANQAGIDAGGIAAASVAKPHKQISVHQPFRMFGGGNDTGMMIGGQANPITDYGTSTISLTGGRMPLVPTSPDDPTPTEMRTYEPGKLIGASTQEARDLSNAIAGTGQQLGIDWGSRGKSGLEQGYEILPEQLKDYGFTPGNYGAATLNYLRTLDPTITERPTWGDYKTKMGVTDAQLEAAPKGLQVLAGNPFGGPPQITEDDEITRLFGPQNLYGGA